MMNPAALQLAAHWQGTLLGGAGGELLLVERIQGHALPRLLILVLEATDLKNPMEAAARAQAQGLALNVLALMPLPGCDLATALPFHRLRLGALIAALDGGLPWLNDQPMLVGRMPGRLFSSAPRALGKAPMGPLEKASLKAFLPHWEKGQRRQVFRRPPWREVAGGFETELWPGVPQPEGTQLRVPPLELPGATPLSEALRAALRAATGRSVPILPLPGDPSGLHALAMLTPQIGAFRGPLQAWEGAMARLARLPSPLHFCARC